MSDSKKSESLSIKTVYLYTASMLGLALFVFGLVGTVQYSVKYFTGGYSSMLNIESTCEDETNLKMQNKGIYLADLRQDPGTICAQPNPYFGSISILTKTIDSTTGLPVEPLTEEEKAACIAKVEKLKTDLQKEFDDAKTSCVKGKRDETRFNQVNQFNNDISRALALLAVGLPIWLLHWLPARKRG